MLQLHACDHRNSPVSIYGKACPSDVAAVCACKLRIDKCVSTEEVLLQDNLSELGFQQSSMTEHC